MGVYVYGQGRSRSAEDQIWEHLDRMRNAGPVADYYLAAHERQAWAVGTGRAAVAGTSMTTMIATACRRWIEAHLMTVGRWLVRTLAGQCVDGDELLTTQRPMAS